MKAPDPIVQRGTGRTWLLRIASLAGVVGAVAAIGVFMRKGDSNTAGLLVFAAVLSALLFAWSWKDSLMVPFEWAKRYVQGVESGERHEWYAFRGQRVRVFLDEAQRPWFALNEIAFILSLEVDDKTFRHYGKQEFGTPAHAPEKCLSESGLRRLLKYSSHADAGALRLWLDRDVLRLLKNRAGREPTGA